jgi:nickel/cobalt transporter (NiCoT) family protein
MSRSAGDQTLRRQLRVFRRGLTAQDRASLGGMLGTIVLLHVVGFGVLFGLVAPHHYQLGDTGLFGAGVGVLAYTFGLRHAFDADHIAAVDNTTRKLLADNAERRAAGKPEQRRPLSVGFWFSLGHSTIVFGLAMLLSLGAKALAAPVEHDGSTLHSVTGVIGASVSGVFLWVLGIVNLAALVGILKVFREMRAGVYNDQQLEEQLNRRGLMNRLLNGLTRSVRTPRGIYPIGVLFGLGFDTATEVGLLVLAGGAAAFNLPFYAILVLPILFAAGMCLADSVDGVFMNVAYGWAFAKPVRKVFYNITITAISVAVAVIIGTIELLGVLADQADISTGPIAAIAGINLDYAGYGIVALFVVCWVVAVLVWRFGRIEDRWSARLTGSVDSLVGAAQDRITPSVESALDPVPLQAEELLRARLGVHDPVDATHPRLWVAGDARAGDDVGRGR